MGHVDRECPWCNSEACFDLNRCRNESKFQIERAIITEWFEGSSDPIKRLRNGTILAPIAGRLMRAWFPLVRASKVGVGE